MNDFGLGLLLLAWNVFYEARGEPMAGKVAVCHVVLNRARKHGLTVEQIIKKPNQFSWYRPGMAFSYKETEESAMRESMEAVMKFAAEVADGKTLEEADHYFNPSKVQPSWAKGMRFVAKIGNHAFYRSD